MELLTQTKFLQKSNKGHIKSLGVDEIIRSVSHSLYTLSVVTPSCAQTIDRTKNNKLGKKNTLTSNQKLDPRRDHAYTQYFHFCMPPFGAITHSYPFSAYPHTLYTSFLYPAYP